MFVILSECEGTKNCDAVENPDYQKIKRSIYLDSSFRWHFIQNDMVILCHPQEMKRRKDPPLSSFWKSRSSGNSVKHLLDSLINSISIRMTLIFFITLEKFK